MHARWTTALGLACLATSVLVGFGAAGGTAAAAEANHALQLVALTGPRGGDVTITVPAAAGGANVDELAHVHVRLFDADDADGEPNRIVNVDSVDAERGVANVALGRVPRGTRVEVQVQIREQDPPRTVILRGRTVAKLRPVLVVAAVHAPPQTLTTRPIDVVADVKELNGESGAEAKLTLMLGPTPVADAQPVTVRAGGSKSVTFEDVRLEQATTAELIVRVEDADPFETDAANNARTRAIDVTEHELVRSSVLVESLGGYGAQLNQHVYAPVTNAPAASLPALEEKVLALEPQLVRIFYNDDFEERQPNRVRNLASFYETVQLAQEAGATINITYQAVNVAKLDPVASMTRFAGVLEDLVEVKGYTNVRWVTVGNEPNETNLLLDEYERLYRALHAQLVDRGLRDHVRLMGGDLVRNNQRTWFQYIAANMSDILDAYSVHIYWNYWDTPFFLESRLKEVRKIVTEELPVDARRPTYVTEFGVRGIRNFSGKPNVESGYWEDGTEMARTNIAAFQQLWFDLAAAQLGFVGSVKWDAYWGKYTGTYNSLYSLIGPAAEGWPLFPGYHSTRLLLQTTARGWQVVEVAPREENDWKHGVADRPEKELAAYVGGDGQMTVLGLDSNGRDLNGVSPESPAYSIGGLPPNTEFSLALWNTSGNGENSVAGTVTTNDAGVARFAVPLHAAFALTTVPVS